MSADAKYAETTMSVELTLPSADGMSADVADTLCAMVGARVEAIGQTLGIPVSTSVTLGVSTDRDAVAPGVRVQVNGRRCRFPSRTLALAVVAIGGKVSDTPVHRGAPPPLLASDDVLAEAIMMTCAEAVRLRPSVLLTTRSAEAYVQRLRESSGRDLTVEVTADTMMRVMSPVLDLGISVSDIDTVSRVLRESTGLSAGATSEALISALRPDTIALLVPRDAWAEFGRDDGADDDLLSFFTSGMFEETGVFIPRVVLEEAVDLPDETFAVRVNHLISVPTRMLPADRILVNDTVERLAAIEVTATAAVNPATEQPAALADATDAQRLEALGLTVWKRSGHVLLHAATLLRNNLGVLVTQDRLGAQLERLQLDFPAVAAAARAQLPADELTALVRALAADRVPLRDLVPVLERVVDLPAADLGLDRYAVLSDPVQSPTASPKDDPSAVETFLRTGLRHHIAQRFVSDPRTLVCYLLDQDVEALVDGFRTEEAEDAVIGSVTAELAYLPATARLPVIVTDASHRHAMQEVLRPALPFMTVLAFEDLPSTLLVQPVARIALPEAEALR